MLLFVCNCNTFKTALQPLHRLKNTLSTSQIFIFSCSERFRLDSESFSMNFKQCSLVVHDSLFLNFRHGYPDTSAWPVAGGNGATPSSPAVTVQGLKDLNAGKFPIIPRSRTDRIFRSVSGAWRSWCVLDHMSRSRLWPSRGAGDPWLLNHWLWSCAQVAQVVEIYL